MDPLRNFEHVFGSKSKNIVSVVHNTMRGQRPTWKLLHGVAPATKERTILSSQLNLRRKLVRMGGRGLHRIAGALRILLKFFYHRMLCDISLY